MASFLKGYSSFLTFRKCDIVTATYVLQQCNVINLKVLSCNTFNAFVGFLPTEMSVTPRAGGYRPGEAREPGKTLICRPVLRNVGFSERYHFELVPVGVFKELDVNSSATDHRVVAAGKRQPAGNEANVPTIS